jgi:hypothetical protein
MPFAWAVRPVFNEREELDTTSEFQGLFKQESQKLMDEDLFKLLADYKKYASRFFFCVVLWGACAIFKVAYRMICNIILG